MISDYRNVRLTGGYWKKKEDLNRDVTIPAVYDRFFETGRIDAFKCDWKQGDPKQPHYFWDSDVAKWMEGAAYALSREDLPALREKVEALIDRIEENQGEDGYFNIYFTVVEPEKRFTDRNCHELYCAGHLMEAACAYVGATGSDRLLKCMEKYADYIYKVFVEEGSAAFTTPGHEEIELALYKMYLTTGKDKYFELMRFFLEKRGQKTVHEKHIFDNPYYAQSHLPIRRQREAFGHSVRAMYLYSGMTDLALETKDTELLDTCRALFDDVTKKKMYVTGGIGSTAYGEAFTVPYDLPNNKAYTETCASIALIYFANRLFAADPEHPSKYADAIELELYNGALSGLSAGGDEFFYENPLEIYLKERSRITATNDREYWPITQRVRVFSCSCCPPNLVRLLASLGDYFYAYDEANDTVYVNQFGDSDYAKGDISVSQKTAYPENGTVRITANRKTAVRIPGWCRTWTADQPYEMKNGYAVFEAGEFTLTFDMKPELITSRTNVVSNLNQAALRFGPLIYCAEAVDNPGDLHTLYFDKAAVKDASVTSDGTFDAPVIAVKGFRKTDTSDELYAPLDDCFTDAEIRLIPYHAFANRGESDMLVFLNYR